MFQTQEHIHCNERCPMISGIHRSPFCILDVVDSKVCRKTGLCSRFSMHIVHSYSLKMLLHKWPDEVHCRWSAVKRMEACNDAKKSVSLNSMNVQRIIHTCMQDAYINTCIYFNNWSPYVNAHLLVDSLLTSTNIIHIACLFWHHWFHRAELKRNEE